LKTKKIIVSKLVNSHENFGANISE